MKHVQPLVLAVALGLAATVSAIRMASGQTTTPMPSSSPTVGIPGSASLVPGTSVMFFRSPCGGIPPAQPPSGQTPVACPAPPEQLTVKYADSEHGAGEVTVSYDGNTLALRASEGMQIQMQPPDASVCAPVKGQPNIVQCAPIAPNFRRGPVTFITSAVTASQTETIDLFQGCNNVSLTWPDGTPTTEVAASITPADALVAIWRFDNPAQTFQGFAPRFPEASDLTTVNRLDAVFVCMSAPGTLTRPAT
jgi:hypothetical protein